MNRLPFMLTRRHAHLDLSAYRIVEGQPLIEKPQPNGRSIAFLACPQCEAEEEHQRDVLLTVQYGLVDYDRYTYYQECVLCGLHYAWSDELEK